MENYQDVWQATARVYIARNPSHPVGRAKYRAFVGGVLTLEVNNFILDALAGMTSSIMQEFSKFSDTPCREVVLINPNAVANIQPDEPPSGDCEAELSAAYEEIRRLRAENASLRDELAYQQEWGGGSLTLNQDGVFIDRDTLRQVGLSCLDAKTPRTAAPLFLYILSLADTSGNADLEAKTVCTDLLGIAKRSWVGLLGDIFGTLILRNGHQLKVTLGRYRTIESNTGTLPTGESIATESNTGTLPTENSNTGTLPETPKVTLGRYFSHVIMNDGDINKKPSLEGSHHSRALLPETQRRLDERQRQLHAIGFNAEVAERFKQTIAFAPDEVWLSWVEQSQRGKNPAGLMHRKIQAYHQRHGSKVINIQQAS